MTFYGRIRQDGIIVASITAPTEDRMLAELHHYGVLYSQEGPVSVERKTGIRGRWRKDTSFNAPPDP